MKGKIAAGGAEMKNAIPVNGAEIQTHRRELVRQSVAETLNGRLEAEAPRRCEAKRYEREVGRAETRARRHTRGLQPRAGPVALKAPPLRRLPFETQIIERCRRRESSVEETLREMYDAGVSMRRVEEITDALGGSR